MVAPRKPRSCRHASTPAWHAPFLAMLPAILENARFFTCGLPDEQREDAIEEIVCNACVAYHRLHQRGLAHLAYPSALARHAYRHFKMDRRVGSQFTRCDVMAKHCQMQGRAQVERLDRYNRIEQCWAEALVEDRHAGPAETAASRLDFDQWLGQMSQRDRDIAWALAEGNRTQDVAAQFGLSAARISQKRREYLASWRRLQGET